MPPQLQVGDFDFDLDIEGLVDGSLQGSQRHPNLSHVGMASNPARHRYSPLVGHLS